MLWNILGLAVVTQRDSLEIQPSARYWAVVTKASPTSTAASDTATRDLGCRLPAL